jgi:hypothetical protein
MIERLFLRLGPNGALGADDLQWILYVPRRKAVPPPGQLDGKDWRAVSFVRSTKAVVARCAREASICWEDTGRLAFEMMPDTFDAWKAAVASSQEAPRAAEIEAADA